MECKAGGGGGQGGCLRVGRLCRKKWQYNSKLNGLLSRPPVFTVPVRVQCADASPARSDTNGHERAAAVRGVSSLLS